MLQTELRDRDGFDSYVVSDCGAVCWMGPSRGPRNDGHNYTKDDVHSVALGLTAGTDINCGNCYTVANVQAALSPKFSPPILNLSTVDTAIRRTMRQRIELGMLDLDYSELELGTPARCQCSRTRW